MVSIAAVATVFIGSSSAAWAGTAQDGLWYFDALHVQAAHDAGVTGAGVTIAVLDSQINLAIPTLNGADVEVQPSECWDDAGAKIPPTSTSLAAFHGTNVTSLIVGSGAGYAGQTGVKGVAPKAKVLYFMENPTTADGSALSCRDRDGKKLNTSAHSGDAVNSAVARGAQIISVSLLIPETPELAVAIANAEHKGVVVVAGLPNTMAESLDAQTGSWPGDANGVVSVQKVSPDATVPLDTAHGQSNADTRADVAAPGVQILTQGSASDGSWMVQTLSEGTSFATPIVSSFLALVKQKYPRATGNQLIQTLIRNTGVKDHSLVITDDGLGYGVASVTHMLQVDPTQYPDKNPLIQRGTDAQRPSAEAITHGVTLKEYLAGMRSPESTATTAPRSTKVAASIPWLLPVIIGGIVLLILAIGVVVFAVRRSRRQLAPDQKL